MAITLQKRPPESRLLKFNFNLYAELVNGDTIASVTGVTGTIVSGTGSLPTQGSPSIGTGADKGKVLITFSGGSPNLMIQYLCQIVTAGGSTLEELGYLQILSV